DECDGEGDDGGARMVAVGSVVETAAAKGEGDGVTEARGGGGSGVVW
nr:hypothetical protein [Tanacetum cinerariifolium]